MVTVSGGDAYLWRIYFSVHNVYPLKLLKHHKLVGWTKQDGRSSGNLSFEAGADVGNTV
jgi:hypothetical protein